MELPNPRRASLRENTHDVPLEIKLVVFSSYIGFLSGRQASFDRRLRIFKILLESPYSLADIKEKCGISYLDAYSILTPLYKAGLVDRSEDGKYSIPEGASHLYKVMMELYDSLNKKFGDKAREYFFDVIQNPAKVAMMYVVYKSRGGVRDEELYEETEKILRSARRLVSPNPYIRMRMRPLSPHSIRRYMYSLSSEHKLLKRDDGWVLTPVGKDIMEILLSIAEKLKPIPIPVRTIRGRLTTHLLIRAPKSLDEFLKDLDKTIDLSKRILSSLEEVVRDVEDLKMLLREVCSESIDTLRDVDVEKIDSIIDTLGRILEKLGNVKEESEELVSKQVRIKRFSVNLKEKFKSMKELREILHRIENLSGDELIRGIESIINTYQKVGNMLSYKARRRLISLVLRTAKRRTPEHLEKILEMLIESLEEDRKIILEVLAEEIKQKD